MILMTLAQLGCKTDPDPESTPPAGDDAPALEEIATGGCGLEPYPWVPLDTMGEIVDWELFSGASLSKEALRGLLGSQDFDVTPFEHGIRTWRIRYQTQDRGVPTEATAMVAIPDDVPDDVPLPTVLWMHPTVGFTDDCAPSGDPLVALINVAFASAGFVLVAPDYLGMAGFGEPSDMLHPYVTPEPTAVASLDALRALEALRQIEPSLGLPPSDGRTVIWGNSEGGGAALWADRYAPYYLPEVEVTAVVAGVPPTDTVGIARRGTDHTSEATLGVFAYIVTQWDWYRSAAPLSEILTDIDPLHLATNAVSLLEEGCDGSLPFTGEEEIGDIYTPALVDAAQREDWSALQPWGCFVESGMLARSPIPRRSGAPVLMVVGENDPLVVGEVERADAARLCDSGDYELEYLECAGLGHVDTVLGTFDEQLAWIRDRLDEEPLDAPCVIGPPVECL